MFPVIILAGGLATRLRPVTEKIPKALVEINGEAFIAHQLRLLKSNGIDRVVIAAGYRGEMIRDFAGDGAEFGIQIDYSFDWPTLLGTAGAIKKALPLLDENFFVLYGDSYLPCNFAAIQELFLDQKKQSLMTVYSNNGLWDKSNVEYSNGCIVRYDKQEITLAMQHIDYGLGIFNKSAFDIVSSSEPYDLAALYRVMLEQNELAAYEVTERFYEIGSFEGIKDLETYLAKREAVS